MRRVFGKSLNYGRGRKLAGASGEIMDGQEKPRVEKKSEGSSIGIKSGVGCLKLP